MIGGGGDPNGEEGSGRLWVLGVSGVNGDKQLNIMASNIDHGGATVSFVIKLEV